MALSKKARRMLAQMDRATALWTIPVVGRTLPGQIVKAGVWSRRYPLPDGVAARLPGPRA